MFHTNLKADDKNVLFRIDKVKHYIISTLSLVFNSVPYLWISVWFRS